MNHKNHWTHCPVCGKRFQHPRKVYDTLKCKWHANYRQRVTKRSKLSLQNDI